MPRVAPGWRSFQSSCGGLAFATYRTTGEHATKSYVICSVIALLCLFINNSCAYPLKKWTNEEKLLKSSLRNKAWNLDDALCRGTLFLISKLSLEIQKTRILGRTFWGEFRNSVSGFRKAQKLGRTFGKRIENRITRHTDFFNFFWRYQFVLHSWSRNVFAPFFKKTFISDLHIRFLVFKYQRFGKDTLSLLSRYGFPLRISI